jgi:glycogen debranching enzyme
MQDVIKLEDQYYILITSARTARRTSMLKHGDTFAVFDALGDIRSAGFDDPGLYHGGTRHLSTLALRIGRDRPLLLSSRASATNELFGADLTNPDVVDDEHRVVLPRDLVHIFRSRFLSDGHCHERLRLVNYSGGRVSLSLEYAFAADFADIFEVRGAVRPRRGALLPPQIGRDGVEVAYKGLDDVVRRTRLSWDPDPDALAEAAARFDVSLDPHESHTVELKIACDSGASNRGEDDFDRALASVTARKQQIEGRYCAVTSSNEQLNEWLHRSVHDLCMMTTDTSHGPYPYAGVPWFSTAFGRDGIITALELLWINPSVARGVLQYLAATQADDVVPAQDAEPGKILHETRTGEMAALHEVPFGRYYGSVDATPLFVVLAGEYYRRTADLPFLAAIWPNIERALAWMDTYGDRDGDLFLEYARRTPDGLVQQGWKDSQDSVFHANGAIADSPVALGEVQGYAYAARLAASLIAHAMGDVERARSLAAGAAALRAKFEEAFWSEELGTYALALDGQKRPCLVRSSNPGHCLYTGIVDPDRARRVAASLLSPEMFSGWGIRTIAAGEARFNPMSYHNGSIWPHDNALAAAGFARYRLSEAAMRVMSAQFDASLFVELRRMPELFCGFRRRTDEGPTLYPVACAPQAWAAGSVFLLLQACLGLSVDALEGMVSVVHGQLPPFIQHITVRGLTLKPGASVDLLFERHAHDVGVTVLDRRGDVAVAVMK